MPILRVDSKSDQISSIFKMAGASDAFEQNILFVGAYCENDGSLEENDMLNLLQAVSWAQCYSPLTFSIAPNVDVCNLNYNSDLFKLSADIAREYKVVVLSNLMFSYEAFEEQDPHRNVQQSALAFEPENWDEMIRTIDPDVLLNVYFQNYPCGYHVNDIIERSLVRLSERSEYTSYVSSYRNCGMSVAGFVPT